MNTIELVNTLPRVFAGQPGIQSEVWLKTLRFERGKKYLISAESGCGKSSLCAYLYGYRKDYEGTFLFDGRSIDELTVEEWCDVRRRHIAYLPQEMRLFPELTALENVELKNRLTGHKTTAEIRSLRTVCQPCDFFLLDEPVSHLDETNNRIVADIITEEAARTGAAVIATSVGNNLDIAVEEALKL